ncbi:TonB-dependent receptor [candidate division KSB1 bacterium]|nr:TonB-dependent receptor [candidate division KSB1 bacterium]
MKKWCFHIMLVLILVLPAIVNSGTTGKIVGKVVDSESGDVLPGVNVVVEGTTLGAASDLNGQFIIMRVPPGIYSVRAMMMGYQNLKYENVKVSIDLTTKLDFPLQATVLEAGEEVTIVATRPLVQMDLTSTSSTIGSETISVLPVESFSDVVNLQAGVVDGHFRGGRSNEVMYMIDGIPVNDAYSGSYAFQVENSAIAELEVITGTFNAEYGQAMSGVVNIVTKEGGDRFSGQISTYIGDYLSSHKDIFWNIDKFNPTCNFEASLDGPVPFTNNKLNFYLSGRWLKRDGYIYGKDVFVPSDHSTFNSAGNLEELILMSHGKVYAGYQTFDALDEQINTLIDNADAIPMEPEERMSGLAKLTWKLSNADKVSYEFMLNDRFYQDYAHEFRYNPTGNYKRFTDGYNNSLIWTHVFGERTFSTFKFNKFLTKYNQYVHDDPYDPRYVSKYRLQDSGANAFLSGGMQMWHFRRSTDTSHGEFDLTSQITNSHQAKVGVEFRKHDLWMHEYEIVTDGARRISPDSTFNNNQYTHRPTELSAYIQDKMEFDFLIVNAGLRFDYFDSDGQILVDYSDPENSPTEEVAATTQISPRLGLAYPITDKGVIHVSYGHFFQTPPLDYLYLNPEFELYPLQSTITPPPQTALNLLGNAALKPQITVMYEIGLQQQLSRDFALDITTFRKDIRNLLGTEVHRLTTGNYYARYINRDYANVKGVTLSLEKRQTQGISGIGGSVDYTYMVARGNASDPNDAFLNAQAERETLKKMAPLDWDRTHQLNATLTFGIPENYAMSLIGRVATGFPYTAVYGAEAYVENGGRKPMIYRFDLYCYKSLKFAGLKYTLFARVYNLLDRLNEREVFPETGRAGYSLTPFWQSYLHPLGINDLEDYFVRPDYYDAPREIQLGITVDF